MEHPHEPKKQLHNIGSHKVESKSNAIGRGRSHCYALLSLPSPSRLSSGGYRPVNLPLAQHCFPTITDNSYSFKYKAYLLQGTSRIRWPGIRLVRRPLGTRYASHDWIPIRTLAVLCTSGRWLPLGLQRVRVRRDVMPISNRNDGMEYSLYAPLVNPEYSATRSQYVPIYVCS